MHESYITATRVHDTGSLRLPPLGPVFQRSSPANALAQSSVPAADASPGLFYTEFTRQPESELRPRQNPYRGPCRLSRKLVESDERTNAKVREEGAQWHRRNRGEDEETKTD